MQQIRFAIGLAQKAGKVASGDLNIEGAFKKGKVQLLLIATDASEATKKNLRSIAIRYSIPVYEVLSKAELGLAIGKAPRASIAILDKNFVIMVEKYMDR